MRRPDVCQRGGIRRRLGAWSVLLLIGASAPASLNAQSRPEAESPCVRASADSLHPDSARVFRHCDVDVAARRRSAARPSFDFPRELSCAIVELDLVVGADGVPVDSTALVLWTNSPEFAQAVVRSLRRWRFRPAQLEGSPVAQRVRERYALSSGRVPFVVGAQGAPPRQLPAPKCE